ncbi:MAG: alpha/beta fold hydrolase [Alphaproteobacteria bacterium]|nr:alpha/beta fold hydrolase [Alphaproteobacteria bacterium]MBU0858856.1 alpha/beta fold hydrolase [Alphaproteobacteria bacterium]
MRPLARHLAACFALACAASVSPAIASTGHAVHAPAATDPLAALRYPITNDILPQLPGPDISVEVFKPVRPDPARLAIVQHGRNGKADAPHMMPLIRAYLDSGYTVVAPNAAYSHYNDSTGDGFGFTIDQHVADMRRAVRWARENAAMLGWDGKNFALAGHSMGGFAASFLAATRYADETVHVLTVAPFTSGTRQIEARRRAPHGLDNLRKELPHAAVEWPKHDIHQHVDKLTMPVSAIVGGRDTVTPATDVKAFFDDLPHPARFTIIPDEHHSLLGEGFYKTARQHIKFMDKQAAAKPAP